jgi:asparagine synthase (glutamine-hydrolysing)
MSLTGGLDTRMVMAWQECVPGALPCYTFGSAYRDCQDVIVARTVARECRQPFTVIPIADEFLSRFAYYAERAVVLTDGCVDASHAVDLFLSERAREIAPVRMTGLYGGEVLRRVHVFKPILPARGLFPALAARIEDARTTYARALEGHALSFAVFRQAPWYQGMNLSLERTQVTMRSPFLDNDFVKTMFRAPGSVTTSDNASRRLIADGNRELAGIPTDRGIDGSDTFRETLDHARLEFLFKAEYAYDYGMPQWLARLNHALKPLGLQRLFLGRHKITHFRVWYGGPLAAYVREVLLDPKSLARPYVDRKTVEHVVQSHLKGERNYTAEIHQLLGLELLCRHFVDGAAAAVPSEPAVATR